MVERARSNLNRLTPHDAQSALERGALLIDIRSESQRAAGGAIPGSAFVPRNALEWRLDPTSESCDPELARPDATIIVMCQEGYQSSLAAATLQELGLAHATDMVGGFEAWRAAGLPVDPLPRD